MRVFTILFGILMIVLMVTNSIDSHKKHKISKHRPAQVVYYPVQTVYVRPVPICNYQHPHHHGVSNFQVDLWKFKIIRIFISNIFENF